MNYEVIVELKPEVLDTQGRAIKEALNRLGHEGLKSVKVQRRFVLEIADGVKDPAALVNQLAAEHLANSVAETFTAKRL
ncbi:MAG: phosphoribosylformylglycinamidine synthase subunit PurS [Bdellovibrionota bacterium]|nr:MAG: phosphoribosylformylglycinamidine synthase, purS protein [Pseudomonadota bacterium]